MSLLENESPMPAEAKIKELNTKVSELEELLKSSYDEQKQVHSQLLQSEKMASVGQLAAGVAHEVNNPTGYILSNLFALREYCQTLGEYIGLQTETIDNITTEKGANPERHLKKVAEWRKKNDIDFILDDILQLTDESLEGSTKIQKIVQGLKIFSHVDDEVKKPADINEGLERTLTVIWNELKYKSKVVREYGDIPQTTCNLGQLNQIFMNLLVNAAHAIERQGQITIKTHCHENTIYASISDTGCGIPQEKIGKIFKPFFTTKEVGRGTGLGLSIADDIIKKHNGEITVESEMGKGSTFTVCIPVV